MDVTTLIMTYCPIIYTELVALFNYVFSYKEPEYKPITVEWFKENISISMIKDIAIEIADQNGLKEAVIKMILPFFRNLLSSRASSFFSKVENPKPEGT